MQEALNNGYDFRASWAFASDKVKITKKGFLTQFPWNLGPVRNDIKYTYGSYNGKCCYWKYLDGICRYRKV